MKAIEAAVVAVALISIVAIVFIAANQQASASEIRYFNSDFNFNITPGNITVQYPPVNPWTAISGHPYGFPVWNSSLGTALGNYFNDIQGPVSARDNTPLGNYFNDIQGPQGNSSSSTALGNLYNDIQGLGTQLNTSAVQIFDPPITYTFNNQTDGRLPDNYRGLYWQPPVSTLDYQGNLSLGTGSVHPRSLGELFVKSQCILPYVIGDTFPNVYPFP